MMCEHCKKQNCDECPSKVKNNSQLCTCQHKAPILPDLPVKDVSE